MSRTNRTKGKAVAQYHEKLLEARQILEETSLEMRQDKELHEDADLAYRFKKSLERINEYQKLLMSAVGALTGLKAIPLAKHKLILPKQAEFL